jgi:antitoxin component of MazEF toxin-antitoxin module
MKLSKVNKNGSLAIVLPKDIVKLNDWKEGQTVYIPVSTKNSLVIQQDVSLDTVEKQTVAYVLEELEDILKSFKQMNKYDDDILKTFLKQQLLITIERL